MKNRFLLVITAISLLLCGCNGQKKEKEYSECLQKALSFTDVDVDSARYWVDMELKTNPTSSDGFFYRAIGHLNPLEPDLAIADLNLAIQYYDEESTVIDIWVIYSFRAHMYWKKCLVINDFKEGNKVIADCERAIALAKKAGKMDFVLDIMCSEGDYYREAREFQKEKEAFKRVLKTDKKNKRAMIGYAMSLVEADNNPKEALRVLNECISLYPDYDRAYLYRMMIYDELDLHKAIDDAIRYIVLTEIDPETPPFRLALDVMTRDMEYSIAGIKRNIETVKSEERAWLLRGLLDAFIETFEAKK